MTLVSDIIRRAHRESNLIPLGSSPSAAQIVEALELFNTLILSTVGNEVGDELNDLNYGGDFDQSDYINQWIPDDTRLVLNLTAALALDADPAPYEGQQMAFVDAAGNIATYNFVISGNGRMIEGTSSVTLNTNSDNRRWLYRADTGNWVKIASLVSADTVPFPEAYDDYFAIMLALRVNPRYGQEISSSTLEALKRTRGQIRSRYRRKNYNAPTDPGLVKRDDYYKYYRYDGQFNTGRVGPWG